jgi:DNA-binding MarR family transcriptional regulator
MTPEQYTQICRELLLTCRDMASITHSQLAPLCRKAGITVQQMYVLIELHENPAQHITQICDRIGIQRTNFAIVSKKMERQGLVKRIQSPNDRRSFTLAITEHGSRVFDEVNDQIKRVFSTTFREIPDDTVTTLIEGMHTLRAGTERMR